MDSEKRSPRKAPGSPARLRDVAALAGVSQGLVSRLLNNDESLTIRDETREAVLRAVRELDYVPNSTASALRRSRTDTFGLGLDHITNPLFRDIVHGAQAAAAELGSALLLIDVEDLEIASGPFDTLIRARRIDGLLLQGGYSTRDLAGTYASRVPTVIVNSPGTALASGVTLQDEEAAVAATRHLLQLGHRRIGFVGGSPGPASEARRRGYVRALQEHDVTPDPSWMIDGGWEGIDGAQAIRELRSRAPTLTAYLAASAVAAMGAMHELTTSGTRVPDDASLIAIHDPWFAELLNPSLSTVALPLRELGYQSVRVLKAQIEGAAPSTFEISDPPPLLITRGSTAATHIH